jgi:CRP-like cAMP-binding protein
MDQKLELLKHVPLFAGLNNKQLQQLELITDEIDVVAGTVLVTEGRVAHEFFIIISGEVAIDKGGQEINNLANGDFLGEIALVDGGPRTATATASTPCRLLVLTHGGFHQLLDTSPEIRRAVMEALGQRLRRLEPTAAN